MLGRFALPLMFFAALLLPSAPGRAMGVGPPTSTIPTFIRVVGSTAGVPDTVAGRFSVTVRDIALNPVPGAFVNVDLSACPDIRMAADQLNPSYTVNCAAHTVGAYTNTQGVATITLLGSSWAAGSYSGTSCARIYADGMLLGSVTVAAADLNGAGGVSGADLSLWLGEFGSGAYRGRSDFDGNGILSAGDLSTWLGVFGRNGSTVTNAVCP